MPDSTLLMRTEGTNAPIYLIRHATCELAGTLLGSADPPLTCDGRFEAAGLVTRLRGESIGRIISSGLRRAKETAAILGGGLNLGVEIEPRLNEISYGSWDGLTWTEIESCFPAASSRKLGDWFRVTPDGGEPFSAFVERLRHAWHVIQAGNRVPTAVVAHRTVNAVLLSLAAHPAPWTGDLKSSLLERIYQFEQPHASYVIAGRDAP